MITISKNDLLNGIRAVKTSCGKANLQPILNTLHLKTIGQGLQITATDVEKSARAVIEANIEEAQSFCVNADKLDSIVSVLDDVITIEIKEKTALIKSGKTKFKLLILEEDDFPEVKFDLGTENNIILPKKEFVDGIHKTIISTSQIEKNILNGICFTFEKGIGYELGATDGNRLSQVKFKNPSIEEDKKFVIPSVTLLNTIKNIGEEVELYFHPNKVVIKTANLLYQTNLLSGEYPPYQQLIPKDNNLKVTINKNLLLKSLEKVATMTDERTNITIFDFKKDELYLTSACDLGKVEDVISIDCSSEIKTAFNFKYILEVLRTIETENVDFLMKSALSPCLIKSDFVYVCMPIHIKE